MLATFILSALATVTTPIVDTPVVPAEKMRCVREQVTGSLARFVRVCHTTKEWESIRNDANAEARRMTRPGTMNGLNQ